jgi:integrase
MNFYPDYLLADFEGPGGPKLLTDFIQRLWGKRSPETRGKNISVVKSFFRWCLEKELVQVYPAEGLRRPKRRVKTKKAVDGKVVERLIDAQPRLHDRVNIELVARVGLRKNELRTLRWRDIHLQNPPHVYVHGRNERSAPISHKGLIAEIQELWEAERRPGPMRYVLHPKRGEGKDGSEPYKPSSVDRWFATCKKRLGAASNLTMSGIRNSLFQGRRKK